MRRPLPKAERYFARTSCWHDDQLLQHVIVLNTLPELPENIEIADTNDRFLLTVALVGKADYLVTGDRRAGLLQLGKIGPSHIVTPPVFV